MKKKVWFISLLGIIFLSAGNAGYAATYKWKDDKGNIHFADDYSKIPARHRKDAEKRKSITLPARRQDILQNKKKDPLEEEKPTGSENTKNEKTKEDVYIADILPAEDKQGNVTVSGQVVNNSKTPATSIIVTISLLDRSSKELLSRSTPLADISESTTVQPGEKVPFKLTTSVPFSAAASINYSVSWSGFK